MSMRWYSLHNNPNNEHLLPEQLTLRRIEAFLTRIPVHTVHSRARKTRPYFPGYVFLHCDLPQIGESALQWLSGASGLVAFENEPGYVPDILIHALRRRSKRRAAGGSARSRRGDAVVIRDGPFQGYNAISDERLSGSERVCVRLKLFQREAVPLHLRAGQIFCPKYGF